MVYASRIALLTMCILSTMKPCVEAQTTRNVSELFRQLQAAETSGQAKAQLLDLARRDVRARAFLAGHLPKLIDANPRDQGSQGGRTMRLEWYNEVVLAGDLKIAEAAPALAKWISFSTMGGATDLVVEQSLQDSPAGMALVQIGDPAISALRSLLYNPGGDPLSYDRRWRAAYVLHAINSTAANSLLQEYAERGQDHGLRDYLRNELEIEAGNKGK